MQATLIILEDQNSELGNEALEQDLFLVSYMLLFTKDEVVHTW